MKELILVTSPPACGKTHVSKELAKHLNNIVYLDKDTLIVLSKQIFVVANEDYNRSSEFFEEHIRDFEYYAIVDLALEALDYANIALINAPFTREIRDKKYIADLKARLAEKGAVLKVIWVETDIDVCHQRMISRNSDRDTWKLQNWDEYVSGLNFDIPEEINDDEGTLMIFKNSSVDEFNQSMENITKELLD